MKRTVLDASALMSFYEDRPGAAAVEVLLREALERKRNLWMSVVNWGEIFYSVWRVQGREAAEKILTQIAQLPMHLVDADPDLTRIAAEFRATHKLPYADCFAASLAQHHRADLATADKDFALIENDLPILWISAK